MHGAQFQPMRTLCDPGGMLENAAKGCRERFSRHAAGAILALVGVGLDPMVGDGRAGGEPDACMALRIVNEATQSCGAAWSANKAAVQADRHHAPALCIEHVETVFEVIKKLIARIKALRGCKSHIIGVQRIGHNQLIARFKFHPIGQIIGIAVGHIGKLPCLSGQADGIF